MPKSLFAGAILALAFCFGAAVDRAAAMTLALPAQIGPAVQGDVAQNFHLAGSYAREWAPREYWQWGHRPIWDDPWRVLKPNFLGSPEPHLVPADIWACKWHPPTWRWHHRQCRFYESWRAR
jgi:hypothetical protein